MLTDRCPVSLSVLDVTLVYCDQTVGWIKMPLGTEVGLGPGYIVLDGDPALSFNEIQIVTSDSLRFLGYLFTRTQQ